MTEKTETMTTETPERSAAEALVAAGRVLLREREDGALVYEVRDGGHAETVRLQFGGAARCSCGEADCVHAAAAKLRAEEDGAMAEMNRRRAVSAGPGLMRAVQVTLPQDGTLKLQVTVCLDRDENGCASVSLRTGEDRLYVVRSVPQLLEAVALGQPVTFGKGFRYEPEWMRYSVADTRVLTLLRAMCDAMGLTGPVKDQKALPLPDSWLELLLEALADSTFLLTMGDATLTVTACAREPVPLYFRVGSTARTLTVTAQLPEDIRALTDSCAWLLTGGRLVSPPENQRPLLRVLLAENNGGTASFEYALQESDRVLGELLPNLKLAGAVDIDAALERRLIHLPLRAQVYLDAEGASIAARTVFMYGSRSIDPFDEHQPETDPRRILLRDAAAERRVLDALGSAGFHVRKKLVYLTGNERIFRFATEGITELQRQCEVFCSKAFTKLRPRRPQLHGSMHMSEGRLVLSFEDGGTPEKEILAILEALSRRQQYYRLRDGGFLDLSGMEDWYGLADSLHEAAVLDGLSSAAEQAEFSLSGYRAVYLSDLLQGLPVEADESVQAISRVLTEAGETEITLPAGLALRDYQRRGVQWLLSLDRLHMGGILADDMGLGKTIQVIALLKSALQKGETALVVAPTTLTYNWLTELERFAPELSAMVLSGSGAQRKSQIDHVRRAGDVDVLITSYPLIRRDIGLLKELSFRFVVLDEAQHIKNAGSIGAAAVKQLRGGTRLALTGTPMENGPGELWSIFDFILPGYLLSLPAFLHRYQDGRNAEDLRRRIRPFLMRRLKKEVLSELPDKQETTLTARMTVEQERVYEASMLRIRGRVLPMLDERGLGGSRWDVLTAMTELRQICCHPALALDSYRASSGKL